MEEGTTRVSPGSRIADPGKQARLVAGIPIVPVFDGYRAVAIAGVLVLHLLILSGILTDTSDGFVARIAWGTVGHAVDILFIVSGFVVFLPTVARRGDFGSFASYAIRRAARLFPAYWLILGIMYVLILTTTVSNDPADPGFRDLALHFTGLQIPSSIFFSDLAPGLGVNPPLWTLSVEIGFYVVLPFIAAIYFRNPIKGLAFAALITVGWNLAFENLGEINSSLDLGLSGTELIRQAVGSTLQLPSWAFSFGLGMTGAWAFVKFKDAAAGEPAKNRIRLLLAFSIVGFVFFAFLAGNYAGDTGVNVVAQFSRFSPEIAIGYSGFLSLMMVLIALGPGPLRRPFDNRVIRQLGDISYGIYLFHMLLAFYLYSTMDMPADGSFQALAIWALALIPASVLYGYLSARYLEQPIRRWARKFGRRESK